jgi:hypothetical protein
MRCAGVAFPYDAPMAAKGAVGARGGVGHQAPRPRVVLAMATEEQLELGREQPKQVPVRDPGVSGDLGRGRRAVPSGREVLERRRQDRGPPLLRRLSW